MTCPDLTTLRVLAQRHAVVTHQGHVSDLRRTVFAIWNEWLPRAPVRRVEAPDFERYDEHFDPTTGRGDVEIWIPVV